MITVARIALIKNKFSNGTTENNIFEEICFAPNKIKTATRYKFPSEKYPKEQLFFRFLTCIYIGLDYINYLYIYT